MLKRLFVRLRYFYRNDGKVLVDLVLLIFFIVLTSIYFNSVDMTEKFFEFSRSHEELNIDELILTLAISSFYLLIFTIRRFNDMNSILKQANTDPLIGILNRRKGSEYIQKEIDKLDNSRKSSSLIMFDIDNFKKINDLYGHDTGDYVLKEIIKIIEDISRKTNIFVRWGGEEFIVLCPDANLDDAYTLAQRYRAHIQNHKFDLVSSVTASFGVTQLNHEDTLRAQIDRADINLYESKKLGKNRVTKD